VLLYCSNTSVNILQIAFSALSGQSTCCHDFGIYRPICKIISLADSLVNFLHICDICALHCVFHYLMKFRNLKTAKLLLMPSKLIHFTWRLTTQHMPQICYSSDLVDFCSMYTCNAKCCNIQNLVWRQNLRSLGRLTVLFTDYKCCHLLIVLDHHLLHCILFLKPVVSCQTKILCRPNFGLKFYLVFQCFDTIAWRQDGHPVSEIPVSEGFLCGTWLSLEWLWKSMPVEQKLAVVETAVVAAAAQMCQRCLALLFHCFHCYLSGAMYRLAYSPADATATRCLLLQ